MANALTKEQWQQHVDDFLLVRQSKRHYCSQHQLNYHQFLYWFDKLTEKHASFVPVSVQAKVSHESPIATMSLPSGQTLLIHSMDALKALLQAG